MLLFLLGRMHSPPSLPAPSPHAPGACRSGEAWAALVAEYLLTYLAPRSHLANTIAWEALRTQERRLTLTGTGLRSRVKFSFCGRRRALRVETSPTCSRISQPRSKSKCFKLMDNVRNHRSPAPGAQRVSEGCMFNINCAPPPRRAARAQTRAARRAPSAHRRRSRPRSRSHSAGCPRVAAGHAASERG